jgi:hypothetical protein
VSKQMRFALACSVLVPLLSSCADGPSEPVPPPAALSTVSATASSHTEVLLTWTPPAGGHATELRIERATGTGSFTQIATVAADVSSYRDVGLTPGTSYRYRVRACGEGGCSEFTSASVTTNALLVITTTTLPDAIRGEPYNGGLNAEGGGGGYVWSIASGSLPAGLALSELGVISGIPETVQTAVFVVRVRSDDGQTATRELTLRVIEAPAGSGLAITTSRLAPARVGGPYGVTLGANGGDGSSYTWTVVSGSLPAGVSLSPTGQFSGTPTATGSSTFTVRVSSGGRSAEQLYTLEVVADDTGRFNITQFEVAIVPEAIRPHVLAAVARWERVITGDLGGLQIPQRFFSRTACGGFGDLVNGTSVDDVIVMMDISPIDGPARILGQAGPCGLRNDRIPFVGVLTLDSDDLTPLVGTRTLTDVIFHEIGHILGFGTTWNNAVLTGGGTNDPRFTGARAVQEYATLGGTGTIPVENTGGAGTADGHWRESVFRSEVLTGFSEITGAAMPLSRMSIAAMADLGYTVDMGEADTYALPGARPAPPLSAGPLAWDVILPGPVLTLPGPEPRR